MDRPELASSIRKRRTLRRRLIRWIVPKLVFALSYALFRSCRMTFLDKHHEDQFLERGEPILYAGFHYGMMLLPYHFRDRDGVVMVSASRDGDLIADTMALFGLRAARGSSTRGGKIALKAMMEEIQRSHCSSGIIVDGPKGPALEVKMGVIELAKETGLPIVPGNWWTKRRLEFGTWDRTIVPLPFAKIAFAFEEPMFVRPEATLEEMEALRRELGRRMQATVRQARRHFGET